MVLDKEIREQVKLLWKYSNIDYNEEPTRLAEIKQYMNELLNGDWSINDLQYLKDKREKLEKW